MLLRNALLNGELVDILISDGMIVDIAAAADGIAAVGISPARTPGPVVDAGGHPVIPGLWDNHVHFSQWTLWARRLDISAAQSAREAASLVARALPGDDSAPAPFVAVGFRDGLWTDAPNLGDLDAATGGRPTILVSTDLHAVWLNTAALELYGHGGHPTGLLREDDAFEITRRIDHIADELVDDWARAAAAGAARRGVVGIVDFEMTWNLGNWSRRMAAGANELRVEFGIYSEHLERAIDLGLRTGDYVSDLLTVGGFKILTDGSLNTRTAYCYDDYPGLSGDPHAHGMLTVPPGELVQRMRRAVEAGITPCVHAIGDHANALALDAFEELGSGGRIEHAQLLDTADLARFAKLGVLASMQPEHAMDDRDVAEHYWAGRTGRSFPFRSLLDAGASLTFGSDAPVAPLDPWVAIAAAVGRTRDGRSPWHPEQAITVGEAIAASSRTTVAIGQPADLVITGLDPEQASVAQLRDMPVIATILAGRFTHNAL